MPEVLDATEYAKRFATMGTMELTDTWDDPMPDAVRGILLEEISNRGYRVKSLSPPPVWKEPVPGEPAPKGPLPTEFEAAESAIMLGSTLGFCVAGLGHRRCLGLLWCAPEARGHHRHVQRREWVLHPEPP